jgi:aminoglycoside/choline kinase family phosphotransferase
MTPEREAARDRLLSTCGFDGARIAPLAADASFRRYDRIEGPGDTRAVLMDAPPNKEDVRPFNRIAGLLANWNLSAPEVLGADEIHGFLLLEDLGDDLFSRLIKKGHDEYELYAAAIDVLADLSERAPPADLPAYDMNLMLAETEILLDWRFQEATGAQPTDLQRRSWRDAWAEALAPVAGEQGVLVLRDYHVDNLIWLPDRAALRRTGLLDFQDAVRGHAAYDVASLLSDVRRDVSPDLEESMLHRYIKATGADNDAFRIACALLATQRNAKIAGIFTRLSARDGKHGYRRWLPRTFRLLRRDLTHPALAPVAHWFDNHLPHDPSEDGIGAQKQASPEDQ